MGLEPRSTFPFSGHRYILRFRHGRVYPYNGRSLVCGIPYLVGRVKVGIPYVVRFIPVIESHVMQLDFGPGSKAHCFLRLIISRICRNLVDCLRFQAADIRGYGSSGDNQISIGDLGPVLRRRGPVPEPDLGIRSCAPLQPHHPRPGRCGIHTGQDIRSLDGKGPFLREVMIPHLHGPVGLEGSYLPHLRTV